MVRFLVAILVAEVADTALKPLLLQAMLLKYLLL
jgi:hypothetical protein